MTNMIQYILAGLADLIVQELKTNGPAILVAVENFILSLKAKIQENGHTLKI